MGKSASGSWESEGINTEVPYLVTLTDIYYPIVGFNVIKQIVKRESDAQVTQGIFQQAIDNSDQRKTESFINFIATSKGKSELVGKIKGKEITTPAGKICNVQCQANMNIFLKKDTYDC